MGHKTLKAFKIKAFSVSVIGFESLHPHHANAPLGAFLRGANERLTWFYRFARAVFNGDALPRLRKAETAETLRPHQTRIKRTLMKSQSSFYFYKRLFRLNC